MSDHFVGVSVKRLSAVDANPARSNQHEIGTTREMRDLFLGEDHIEHPVRYIRLGEDQDGIAVEGRATHYDARNRNPERAPEWRLYYPTNEVTDAMREGDSLFLAKHKDGILYFIVTPEGSTSEEQLLWLFGMEPAERSFVSKGVPENGPMLDFAARYVLDEIGIEVEEEDTELLDRILGDTSTHFPNTREFSSLARNSLPDIRAVDDPDVALLAWLTREEALFLCLENRIVWKEVKEQFFNRDTLDVGDFIRYANSIVNRRKSRMGYSLEHHLEAIFQAFDISYDRGKATENNNRPDFLFPSARAYHDAPRDGAAHLTMLGVKSTCKDRWRQVLSEADKISRKHLFTLEPRISVSQTNQMENSDLQLVVPREIMGSYTETQRTWLWDLGHFVEHLKRYEG